MHEFKHSEDIRKNRILDAALDEFSDKGYRKGSTNTIVKEANVSKGLLFHYFGSKKGLFISLFEYCSLEIQNELFTKVNLKNRDVLERCKAATIGKIKSYSKHPLFTHFFEKVREVEDEEILLATSKISKEMNHKKFGMLFENIDYFVFKESINIDRALKVIGWTLEQVANDWQEQNHTVHDGALKELQHEIDDYLDLLKDTFYR